MRQHSTGSIVALGALFGTITVTLTVMGQEVDRVSAPNDVGVGMAKGIAEQLGNGVGNENTFGSSRYLIARDPARAIRRGRNLFQRKFKHAEGAGPRTLDGTGDITSEGSIGAGLADSCALCHGRPRGSAGFGGDVFTRPDSRDAPHLFGLGIQEQLADEMTQTLRSIRDAAIEDALSGGDGLSEEFQDLFGFEDLNDWTAVLGGTIASSSLSTEGTQSLAVTPVGWTEIDSVEFGGLEGIGSSLSFDLRVPSSVAWGEVRAILISPSRSIWWGELGSQQLPGLPTGAFTNVSFPISASMQAALEGAPDVTIKLVVNGPTLSEPYLIDQLVMATGGGEGPVTAQLTAKGINYGFITVDENGVVDLSNVEGVNDDLRVRPFFAEGSTISMREFIVGAFNAEMGIQITDPIINTAAAGGVAVTPGGMILDGTIDAIEASPLAETTDPDITEPNAPGLGDDAGEALVDFMEFYLLNYFKPGHYEETPDAIAGRALFGSVGCTNCHQANFTIDADRRVADVETNHRSFFPLEDQPPAGVYNNLFAVASGQFEAVLGSEDENGFPLIVPQENAFVVEDIFTDFKRHDLGTELHERNFDDTIQREFITEPLWGVGSSAPYGHDGRSINLQEIILRHGGEAADVRQSYLNLSPAQQGLVQSFLSTLILFPPDDTASNLNLPGDIDPSNPDYPQRAHGNIRLPTLFQIASEGPE